MKKVFCIISHTHWDREWYMSFEKFRLKLVDLIDRLIGLIEEYPEYVFHLDAQTIVLEDYLEIRPQNREILKKYIKSGNIIIGPWYLQNDFYLTSGEATIRNLIEGTRVAEEFGACAKVGYAPDQFGHISQMPQILSNFGIDNYLFARGFSAYFRGEDGNNYRHWSPLEFKWRGPDGTELLAVNMRGFYNNAQHIPEEAEKAKILTDVIEKDYNDKITTEFYLLMNGVDHLEPQTTVLEAMDTYNQAYGETAVMKQYTMEQYMRDVQKRLEENQTELPVHEGELRKGSSSDILPGTLSSRHYLKVSNNKLQDAFEQNLEPLYSMLELAGCKGIYSLDHFRYGWKKLMQNHPHDSICGCSRDEVHKHMEDSFERLGEFAKDMFERGMTELCYHTEIMQKAPDSKYYVNVVNTTNNTMSGVIPVELDFIAEDEVSDFDIEDAQGNPISFALLSKERVERDVFSPLNLPGRIWVDRHLVYIRVDDVAPYSAMGLAIVLKEKEMPTLVNKEEAVLENDYIKATVDENGKVDVYFKKDDLSFEDVVYFEDRADRGDAYNWHNAWETPITSKEFKPQIEVLENNAFVSKVKVTWNMMLPAYYDFEELKRSDEKNEVTVDLVLELKATDKVLGLNYSVNNTCSDHRLRMMVNTDFTEPKCMADMPFDIVERVDATWDIEPTTQTFPNTSFVSLEEQEKGLAVFTEGAHEAEHMKPSVLAITLVRSTSLINRQWDLLPGGGEVWTCPANQCLREINGRVALYGYVGDVHSAGIPEQINTFRVPLKAMFIPADRKRFAGGRTAVQDSRLSEFFYLPDYYPKAIFKEKQSLAEVKGKTFAVSALKLAEDQKGIVLRFYNYGIEKQVAEINVQGEIFRTNMAETTRDYLGKDKVSIEVKPKEIVTLYVSL